MSYQDFIASKHRRASDCGIDISEGEINPYAFEFQRAVIKWACKKGRAAIFADCGLGKTLMELAWLDALTKKGEVKRSIILCPIAVANQIIDEAEKFGVNTEIRICESSADVSSGINVTNYEKLHKFDPSDFDAVVLNEASVLKNAQGKVRKQITEAFRHTKYRMSETATPAPNDHMELGTQSEFLGWMQRDVMLANFFIHDGGDTSKWRLRGHANREFWDWVASWAMAITKPSDIGFKDDGYDLPELKIHEHIIQCEQEASGHLFHPGGKVSATNVHKEKRRTIEAKAVEVANLVNGSDLPWVIWCETNYEDEVLRRHVSDAVVIRGNDKGKAEKLQAFTRGDIKRLITKPKIGGYGMNWQHCNNTIFFASYKFEDWYQVIRRFWRFGQKLPVNAHLMMSEDEIGIANVLKRKQHDFERMASEMAISMRSGMLQSLGSRQAIADYTPHKQIQLPEWMQCQNV